MRRLFLTIVFAAFAAGLLGPWAFEMPRPLPPALALIETDGPATPLDAALILRATARYDPARIAFVDPLAGEEGAALLQSRLEDTRLPVRFASAPPAATAANVAPPARITFDQLMIRTERSERGELTTELDALFRGRAVLVEAQGGLGWTADATPLPPAKPIQAPFAGAAVLLGALLPWISLPRHSRAVLALALGCLWLLMALTERSAAPIALVYVFVLLPVLGWLVPPPGERPE